MPPTGRKDPASHDTRTIGKEVRPLEIDWNARRAEAWALIRKGGFSAKIARRFLTQHGAL